MPGRSALTVRHAITPSHQTRQSISPMGRYESLFVLRLATTVFVTEAREVLQRLIGELPQRELNPA